MNLSKEQIQAVIDWRKKFSDRKNPPLSEIQEILKLKSGCINRDDYVLDGHIAFEADPSGFDPEYIEDVLTPERFEALSNGKRPTKAELKTWTDRKESKVFEEDGWWYHFYLWRIDLPGETILFMSLHGDGGLLDDFTGPFNSEEEALSIASNLELNPRNN